jgi:molecular chaperone GrpE
MDNKYPSAAADAQDASASVAESPSADLAILQKELGAQKDVYLRLATDFDNFKRRTRRDSERQAAAEKESFIRELLPVLDNLERALASEQFVSTEQLHQGVEITMQELSRLLHCHGIEAVEDVGQPFDPHRHEAVSVRHDRSQPDHVVLEVILHGYSHGDKVFRPAKVIVNDLGHSPGPSRVR